MKNIKIISDLDLLSQIKILAMEERKLTTLILELLREVERRRLFAQQGYASLFDYAVKALGYSEASAARRINSMRLLSDIPELKDSIEQGNLNLSTVSSVQTFFKREQREKGRTYTIDEKRALVNQMENRSQRQCEIILMGISPESVRPKEKSRVISPQETELKFAVSSEFMEKIEKLKGLLAHSHPHLSFAQLFELLADRALDQIDPVRKQQKLNVKAENKAVDQFLIESKQREFTPTSELKSELKTQNKSSTKRFIPAAIRRQVWWRDGGRCTFIASDTGVRCESRFSLEVDHVNPVCLGGRAELEGLRLLCRQHNTWEAIRILGYKKMQKYIPKLK